MYKCIFLILFFAIVSITCESPTGVTNIQNLYPLTPDNFWRYKVYTYSNGEIIQEDSLLITIDGEFKINIDGNIYTGGIEAKMLGETKYTKWIYTNLSDGLYILGGIAGIDTSIQKFMYLKYPVLQGQKWDVPYLYYNTVEEKFVFKPDSTYEIKCVSGNQIINIEAGDISCIEYYFEERPEEDVLEKWDYYLYYSPGIGLIKREVLGSLNNRLIQKIMLVEYKVL
jgi:hypothetical protein